MLVTSAQYQNRGPSEGSCGAIEAFTIGLHLGSPLDLWVERDSRKHHGKYIPGDLTIVPPNIEAVYRFQGQADFCHLYIQPDFIRDTCGWTEQPSFLENRFQFNDALISNVLHATAKGGSKLFLESAAVVILERLRQLPMSEWTASSMPRIRAAIEFMKANIDDSVSLADLSRVSGLSASQFLRVFRATTHFSPHRYLMSLRLERAKLLLQDYAASIADVSLATGFSSQSHFTAAFRRATGVTPKAFRLMVYPQPFKSPNAEKLRPMKP